jgi:PKD repeat protein
MLRATRSVLCLCAFVAVIAAACTTPPSGGVNAAPKAVLVATPSSGTVPVTVSFDGLGSTDDGGPISNYAWTFGDGGTATGPQPMHTYAAQGSFTATLTVTDAQGLTGSATKVIVVGGPNRSPLAVAGSTPGSGKVPLAVTFSSAGSNDPDGSIASYRWEFGDGATSTDPSPLHTYTTAGDFSAVLTVTDDRGATGSDTVSLTVNANQSPTAVAAANVTSGQAPLAVSFSSAGSADTDGGIAGYAWAFGDGATSTDASPVHTYSTAGSFTARLTVTDTDGATGVATVPITVTTRCSAPANQVIAENCRPGNPASEWQVSGAGDPALQGFTTDLSVNRGGLVQFKVDVDLPGTPPPFRIDIYRLGWYGGDGARKVTTLPSTATTSTNQPACLRDDRGVADCGNWTVSAQWAVPADAVSGLYIGRLVREDGTGGASHVPFVVRDDNGRSDVVMQTSDTTWQAYNRYGGASLYGGDGPASGGRARAVSYNRPFTTRADAPEDWLFNAEFPMLRFLERNGYDVSYLTGVDSDRAGAELRDHRAFLSVGHDEYWSGAQRANVEAARDAGVNLAFFSGNEMFWKTRWMPSIDGSATDHRTLVSYKETHDNAKVDPAPEWTGTWRDNRPFNPEGSRPENAVTGTIFTVNCCDSVFRVPAEDGRLRLWRNTSMATQADGATAELPAGYVGYEWDEDLDNGARPAGQVRLSSTDVSVDQRLLDQGSNYGPGQATHSLVMHRAGPANALVFGAGTVQWSWGLDSEHDRGGPPADVRLQQATVNLFADMNVQPATLQSGLTPASTSTDTTAPVAVVTPPTTNPEVGAGFTVTGTATDGGGGRVGGIEVSVDGGTTWRRATGRGSWSYTFTPTVAGSLSVRARATDDSANLGAASAPVAVTVNTRSCPCSVWDDSVVPPVDNDTGAIELGVKFRPSADGWITGVRFYKGPANTGTHTGSLWSATGTNLGTVTFSGESASGWQTATFDSPIAVTAGTTYVASYHAPNGGYAFTSNFFTAGLDAPPLRLLASGEDGPNGVYHYGAGGVFPTDTYQASNYWVDVVFNTTVGPDITGPRVSSRNPSVDATSVGTGSAVRAAFNEALAPATLTTATVRLRAQGDTADVAATVAYDAPTRTVTLQPVAPLAFSTRYTATLQGGIGGITDVAGNPLDGDSNWSFTTAAAPPVEGPGGPVLLVTSAADPFDRYYAEILRAEGLNAFSVSDLSLVTPAVLAQHSTVLLAANGLTPAQVTMFGDWVGAGGDLVAMRPDPALASLLGLTPGTGTLTNGYLRIDPASTVGAGLVHDTIQFKGTADRYTADPGTSTVATLYSDAATATPDPAVTRRAVGTNGGSAAAFTYDLARAVVYLRQGNPAWVNQNRDGQDGPNRSDDLFFGAAAGDVQPDWVDLTKVAIPQADEQQRLLANLLVDMTKDRQPLPRFWYLPHGEKAAVVLTGDEHNGGDPKSRMDAQVAQSPAGCAVADWQCVRSTVYLYPDFPSSFTPTEAASYAAQGFEVALHANTGCTSYDRAQYGAALDTQIAALATRFPGLPASRTNRNHCISWSDWSVVPEEESKRGMRLDTNYYFWPPSWVSDTPGLFTGSGFPMRFAQTDGTLIDTYQAATQMTDESGQSYPSSAIALMDRAVGPEGYYGTFVTNFHTDNGGSNATSAGVVAAAQARGVPLISAAQLLDWTDGRNASTFDDMAWNGAGDTLSFGITPGAGANGLEAMLPLEAGRGTLSSLSRNGSPVTWRTETIKGIAYAIFPAAAGSHVATYTPDTAAPVISGVSVTTAPDQATISWTTDEPATSQVDHGPTAALGATATAPGSSTSHTVTVTGLVPGTVHHYVVRSADGVGNTASSPPTGTATFTTPTAQAVDTTSGDFGAGTTSGTYVTGGGSVTLAPTVGTEFDGTSLPPGWAARPSPWTGGGQATVGSGRVTVDGTAVKTAAASTGDLSVEFEATIGAQPFQLLGLTSDVGTDDFVSPWAVFGTTSALDGVRARTSDGTSVLLGADLLGTPHRYRITRTATRIEWWVDGVLRYSLEPAPAADLHTAALRPVASDYNAGGATLQVDSVHMTPYTPSGTFTSRVIDAGGPADWGNIVWDAEAPAGTTLTLRVRTGATPTPDGSWSAYTPVTAGTPVGLQGRFAQYEAAFGTASTGVTPTLDAVRLSYVAQADTVAPSVSGRSPASGATDVPIGTTVGVTFDEPMNPSTITTGSVRLEPGGGGATVAAALAYDAGTRTATLTPLAPLDAGATYDVVIEATATDLAGNPLGSTVTWSFTTTSSPPAPTVSDSTVADFSAGTPAGVAIADGTGGELVLQPTVQAEFAGTAVPAGWSVSPWTGGDATVAGGSATVDGALLSTDATFSAGRSVEFVATIGGATYQNIGFGQTLAVASEYWAMFGTGGSNSTLFARTNLNGSVSDVAIPGSFLGSPHRYRIDWTADAVVYSIDGTVVHTASASIPVPLRLVASDYQAGAPALGVDWMRSSPYAASGTFESRVVDGGAAVLWSSLGWDAEVPAGTTVSVSVRSGDSAVPDGSWTPWSAPAVAPGAIGQPGRYLQYRVTLATSDDRSTPTVRSVTVGP